MKWVKDKTDMKTDARVPVKSWCENLDAEAMSQASNLAAHPVVEKHVALMPDAHVGYGMPIGGVIACNNAVIPNAVGVDIGCGMGAIKTNARLEQLKDMPHIRAILDDVKKLVPVGEGRSHQKPQEWDQFEAHEDAFFGDVPGWFQDGNWNKHKKNLGTLGGGNHFIELQASEDDEVWMMLHSGSRNLGYRVANFYHKLAQALNERWHVALPSADLAFLPLDTDEGQAYVRDMNFALDYARENRRRMMEAFKAAIADHVDDIEFLEEINIHHNYAAIENHFDRNLWVHRKGATSAKCGEMGIIPGSMGASSYIVQGKGNPESFMSCSHGAGRKMGRMEASRRLTVDECDAAMDGIVFDRWNKARRFGKKQKKGVGLDLGEAPQAYKDIDAVIEAQLDLIEPVVKLRPLGVIKG